MEQIWAPWRSKYIDSFKNNEKNKTNKNDCFICEAINNKEIKLEKDFLIITRRKYCIALLNKYPYNNGHILVAPLKHISDFTKLEKKEILEITEVIKEIIDIEKQLFNPNGFNIGVNIGQAAGAGLPDHIHFHIVPRWSGDSNFMAICADIKVISNDIMKLQEILYNLLNK